MSVDIPLRDKKGNIVNTALISPEDESTVKQYRWFLSHGYACCHDKGKGISIHQMILGKPTRGMVIDHINHNILDNRRENLRFATRSQNSQNRTKTKNTTSEYMGVSFKNKCHKWVAQCGGIFIGYYTDVLQAATMYDKCAYVLFGEYAKTNGLIAYTECKNLRLEDLVKTRTRQLPKNIYRKHDKFYAHLEKNGDTFQSDYFRTQVEAEEWLHNFQAKLDQKEQIEDNLRKSVSITRNNSGQAIISCLDVDALVDDDLWHELSKYSWSSKDKYLSGYVQGEKIYMHKYVMILKGYDLDTIRQNNCIIDHINHVQHDNRYSNLRVNTFGGNSHNKTKLTGTSSLYIGVTYNNNCSKWSARIHKDYKQYNLGLYNTEIEAAIAYNTKALELYGEYANLNQIDDSIQSQYEVNLLDNQQKIKTSKYRGVYYEKNARWVAQIVKDKKHYFIGRYNTEKDAAIAYNNKAIELYGQLVRLNVIESESPRPKIQLLLKRKIDITTDT